MAIVGALEINKKMSGQLKGKEESGIRTVVTVGGRYRGQTWTDHHILGVYCHEPQGILSRISYRSILKLGW